MKEIVPNSPDVKKYKVVLVFRLWGDIMPLRRLIHVDLLLQRMFHYIGNCLDNIGPRIISKRRYLIRKTRPIWICSVATTRNTIACYLQAVLKLREASEKI